MRNGGCNSDVSSGTITTSVTRAVLNTRATSTGRGPCPWSPREVALMTISKAAGSQALPASTVQAGAARRTVWATSSALAGIRLTIAKCPTPARAARGCTINCATGYLLDRPPPGERDDQGADETRRVVRRIAPKSSHTTLVHWQHT